MFIDHITIYVDDVEEAKDFYEKYFEGESNHGYNNRHTNTPSYYITFGGGGSAKLQIIETPEGKEIEHEIFYLSYMADTKEEVDEKVEELREAGYTVVQEPVITHDNYYTAEVLDPSKNRIKILYGKPGGLHCAVKQQRKEVRASYEDK